jgi:CRISPR-associated protein Cas2
MDEDIFLELENKDIKSDEYFCVAIYDVVDDKKRLKMSKLLESYGKRVEKSAFECYLTKKEIICIERKVRKIIDNLTDDFRIYRMNKNDSCCICGAGEKTKPVPFLVL